MWLIITIFSYLLNAIVSVIDKFLISKKIPEPVTYSFFIGILSIFALFLFPFGQIAIPSLETIFISIFTGILFILALLFFFQSLRVNEASRVVPIIGSFIAPLTVILSSLILKEKFSSQAILAIIFLIIGGFLISFIFNKNRTSFISCWHLVLLTSFIFALSFVLTKLIYSRESFVNGFIWIRIGSFIFALSFLIIKKTRKIIFESFKEVKKETSILFLANQGISAVSFLSLNFAISLGSVSLINSLQGLQYIFVFLMALLISKKYPYLFKEETNFQVIIQKIVGIILIFIGLFILAFNP